MTPRYVQHMSGQGEKWEMDDCASTPSMWRVHEQRLKFWFDLPKSEYRLCEPPERWVDVTEQCRFNEYGTLLHNDWTKLFCGFDPGSGYRLVKTPGGFRVEKKDV